MQRLLLFLFLVVAVPGAVYWVSHGFEGPGDAWETLRGEVSALRGPTAPAPPEPVPERKKPPKPKEDGPPPPPSREEPPAQAPEDRALELFRSGQFDRAAAAYAGVNEEQKALADLGAALATAFPKKIPNLPYLVAQSEAGTTYEGFAEESGANVRLTSPGGRSLSLPSSTLGMRTELGRDAALERLAGQIAKESATPSLVGARLFALLQESFAIGRGDLAAPLLARAMAQDDEEHFFLSSVRSRVPAPHQAAVYRAYGSCQLSKSPEMATVSSRAPLRIGGGNGGGNTPPAQGTRPLPSEHSSVKDEKALSLMKEASPLRAEGEKLYRKIAIQDLKDVNVADIHEAIRLLDAAAALYEKAMEIEDSNETSALLRHSSKLLYSLRFWKQQAEGR